MATYSDNFQRANENPLATPWVWDGGYFQLLNDLIQPQFGSVDGVVAGRAAAAVASHILEPVPSMVLNPGECGLIYLWYPAMATTGITLLPEFGWWER